MRANEASKWRPIYRNVQLDEKCKINTLGRWWRARRGAGRKRGGVCGLSPELPRGEGEKGRVGGRKVADLCPKRSSQPAHNRVAKSTRGDLADYLRGSTRRGRATPLRPCLRIDAVTRGPVIASGPPRPPPTMDSLTRTRRD